MRPCASLAMCRSLTKVIVVPSAAFLTASVDSVAEKGACGMGGMTILSRTSRTPPSCDAECEFCSGSVSTCAPQVMPMNQKMTATEVRISKPSTLQGCYDWFRLTSNCHEIENGTAGLTCVAHESVLP